MGRAPVIVRPGRVTLRHVKPSSGSPYTLLGTAMAANPAGLNDDKGWSSGDFTLRVSDDGDFHLTLPNIEASDEQLHRDRLRILTDDEYKPGDEWFEVWRGDPGQGDLEFAGTPTKSTVQPTQIALEGIDPTPILRKQRDTAAAFHLAGPLDVFLHACSAWTIKVKEDFTDAAPVMNYSASTQLTSDGRFNYRRAQSGVNGVTIHDPSSPGPASGEVVTTETVQTGLAAEPWRVETILAEFLSAATFGGLTVGPTALNLTGTTIGLSTSGGSDVRSVPVDGDRGVVRLALEGRGRWIFGYVNDRLIGVIREKQTGTNASTITISASSPGSPVALQCRMLLARQTTAFLRPTLTDRRLAGAPTPTGLQAKYFSLAGKIGVASSTVAEEAMSPVAAPAAQRIEKTVTHAAAAAPTWQPAAAGARNFAARWTGAIYLPLATSDVKVRAKHSDGVRIWIGKTKATDPYVDAWSLGSATDTGASLRTHLGQSDNGWYPIIVEWFWFPDGAGSANAQIELEYELNGSGSWVAIGDTTIPISPYGVVEQNARLDSLWELRRLVVESFGYQHRLVPKSLESGLFPGVLEIGTRVGRDTEKVLDTLGEAVESQQEIDASDVADFLLVDAAGIADPTQSSQLTYEAFDLASLSGHVFLHSDQDSASEITDKALLEQRATSTAALRRSPWTQVQTRPAADNEILRNITSWSGGLPVYGSLALHRWECGDGLRIQIPSIGVNDQTARQIMGVTWPFFQDGFGAPQITFRQRPRGLRETWYRQVRKQAAQSGHYQGQLATIAGSLGSSDATRAPDGYSRLVLPPNIDQIVSVELVVLEKGDTSTKTVEINAAGTVSVKTVGSIDVTAYVALIAAGSRLMYARLTGGTSSHTIQLVATIAI